MRADSTSTAVGRGASGPGASRPAEGADRHAEAIEVVRRALREIEYGSVLITIHQGEVVGIETSTKVRLKAT